MRVSILAFAFGVLVLQNLPTLPSRAALIVTTILVAIGVALCCVRAPRPARTAALAITAFAVGSGWAGWRAEWRLAEALPMTSEARDAVVTGVVDGLPEELERGVRRFVFSVETSDAGVPSRVRLSWYPSRGERVPDIRAGQRWRLVVRLKRPHGLLNPGGFDYEGWLLQRGIRASGYVREDARNARLDEFAPGFMSGVHRVREAVRERLRADLGDAPHAGMVIALAVGDQRGIESEHWEVFRRTAVGHLVAISGLHVSLVALAVGGLAGGLWRRRPRLVVRVPARRVAALCGLVAATAYALLAGLGLPTQRALIMLAVAALALAAGRESAPGRVLALALAAVLIFDPWAVLAGGFWLSFGAVAVIVLVASGRLEQRGALHSAVRIQLAITLALAPVLLALFGAVSAVGPLANAFAIPLVSFVIAPLVLLSIVVPVPWLPALAHTVTGWMMAALEWLAALPFALWHAPAAPLPVLVCAVAATLWLLMPRGTPGKVAAALALLPLFVWSPARPLADGFRAMVFDVGQGLAVHVQTARHDLLFDTGPPYGPVSDAGARVILPALRSAAVGRLDALVLSHGDADHVGGAASLIGEMPVEHLWLGSGAHRRAGLNRAGTPCVAGEGWEWDGVRFEFLHPQSGERPARRNEGSCVLRVVAPGGTLLLPGDIGAPSERDLTKRDALALASDVVVVAHHGSRGSSAPAFVTASGARHAIHAVGNLNRYRHPHPDVWSRWARAGARNWRTDAQGAILVEVDSRGVEVSAWRERHPRYWHGR
ncbi:DNA internalization-related competence protein ComEC/Rec2 [Pseudazoarcus pumilus]|uniref:DNA internalization-related competence protein ComEC/Rec2 n=1 Tax=Pseudazoarcus pumilus TaxID=2067960 RepID=A0A2I6S770_9RHOO|nr:DNA internalization-related competence protein ComEC/Rec2 [Pseudazoarcus pumilus]AUN95107.1 DNA internalization-related competence protein ComEC/Rec2 [Pseudazoarcus pumilus]